MSGAEAPLVSTILCTYNQAEYVREAVESVLSQTYENIELIVIDNGSKDGAGALLLEYEGDPRVRLMIHRENEAVTKRLNQGISASRGEFISILYGDDYYLPEKFERQVDCFSGLGADYGVVYAPGYRLNVFTGAKWLDSSPNVSGAVLGPLLLDRSKGFINPISPLMRRECFEKYPFYEDLFSEGESINLRFAMSYKFHYIDEPLVVMRDHDGNLGKAIKGNVKRLMIVLDRLKVAKEFPPRYRDAVELYRSGILRDCGWDSVRGAGDLKWARSCLLGSIRTCPRQLFHPRTVAGLLLSFLPGVARKGLNRLADRVRGHQGVGGFLDQPEFEPR